MCRTGLKSSKSKIKDNHRSAVLDGTNWILMQWSSSIILRERSSWNWVWLWPECLSLPLSSIIHVSCVCWLAVIIFSEAHWIGRVQKESGHTQGHRASVWHTADLCVGGCVGGLAMRAPPPAWITFPCVWEAADACPFRMTADDSDSDGWRERFLQLLCESLATVTCVALSSPTSSEHVARAFMRETQLLNPG